MSGLNAASAEFEKAVVETETRLANIATKVDSVLNQANPDLSSQGNSTSSGVSVGSVLQEFHSIKSDFQDIVGQVEALKQEQQQFLQDIQTEIKVATAAAVSKSEATE